MILEISLPGQLQPVCVAATQVSICADNGTIVGLATAFGADGNVRASVAGNSDFPQMLRVLEVPPDRWPSVRQFSASDPKGIVLASG